MQITPLNHHVTFAKNTVYGFSKGFGPVNTDKKLSVSIRKTARDNFLQKIADSLFIFSTSPTWYLQSHFE